MKGDDFNRWHNEGNALHDLGRLEEALDAYERAIRLNKNHFFPWNGKGNVLYELERFDEALDAYEQGIKLDKNHPFPWNGKGNALMAFGQVKEALDSFERSIELDKIYHFPWNGKGNALADLGFLEEALDAYERSIKLGGTFFPWNGKGNTLYSLGRYRDALEAFEQSIKLNQNYPGPWHGKGRALKVLGDPEEARRAFKHFCYLASPWHVIQGADALLEEFYRFSHQAPLLLLRLVFRAPILLAQPGWFEAIQYLQDAYKAPLACLNALNSIEDSIPNQIRLRAAGCLAFHFGDPIVAEDQFDTLDDYFPGDLLGQYYLISSRYDYCADITPCLSEALEAATSYHGNDPEQHYYAARILAFADKKLESLKSLQNSGDYAPALLLCFDMAKEQGDAPAMKELAKRFLEVERATPTEWRLLHPTPPEDFDLSSQDWLAVVLHYAKQQELMGEIQAFLEEMDEPPFFEQRHTYADVLLVTHTGAWDLKTAWNLDATSQAFIDGLMAERDDAALADLHAELRIVSVPFNEIDACPAEKLESRLAVRLEEDKVSFNTERRLNVYLYKKQRLTLQASFSLMLFSLVKEGRKSPEDIKSALFDAYLAIASGGAALVLGPIIPAALGAALGTGAFTGVASFVWHYRDSRKKAAREAAAHDLDYRTFKSDLQTFMKEKKLDLPETFWK